MKKIIIIALVLFMASCGSSSDNESKKAELANLKTELSEIKDKISSLEKDFANDKNSKQLYKTPVRIKEVRFEKFDHFIEVSGTVEAVNAAFISPEMGGQIKEIYVNEGDRVSKGQLLARLNSSTIDKNIDELNTGLNYASIIFGKQKKLWDQKIGSEIDYLTAKNAKEGLEAKLESLKAQLELLVIKAPFDGIIDDIIQKVGELAVPGAQMMQLLNLNKLYINADVAETYLPFIHKGDKVELSFPTFPELAMNVSIHRIGNVIHPQNRTVNMQLKINNNKEQLKPNGLAIIQINDFSTDKALIVPSIVIKQDLKGSFLYILKKGGKSFVAEKKYVQAGIFYKDQSMIISGLNAGDKVIIEGYNQISDGSAIEVII